MSANHVTVQHDGDVAFVVLDRGKVNAIDERVLEQLDEALSVVESAERMRRREAESIHEFVEIWYSEPMRERLRGIKIRR